MGSSDGDTYSLSIEISRLPLGVDKVTVDATLVDPVELALV